MAARSLMFRTVLRLAPIVAIALAAVLNTACAQQSDLKARVEAHQREVRQKLDKAKRDSERREREMKARMGAKYPSPSTKYPLPSKFPSPSAAASRMRDLPSYVPERSNPSAPPPVEYLLTVGKTFGYWVVLETTTGDKHGYLAGVALFRVDENSGSARLSTSDNLDYVGSLKSVSPRCRSARA